MEDPRSPFFLHHGESPGAILVSQSLTKDNYSTWARAMRMALDAKSKLEFMDGSITASMAANGPRISQLQKQISTVMQGDSTVTSFFTGLQIAWDQLLNFRPLPCCVCDSLMQFLNGLNDTCSQVRTQFLMMEPIPSLDKAFSLVIQEERQRALGFNVNPFVESTALAVKNQGFNQSSNFSGNASKNIKGNRGKGRPICSHCGKIGHVMEKCYKLVGFPPGYKQRGRVSMANQVIVEGDQAQSDFTPQTASFPFTSEQCQQLLSMLSAHASALTSNYAIYSANSALLGNSYDLFQESMPLSMKHSIFAVNPSNKTAFGNETWVLDTGATDHIVHSVTLFTKITSCVATFVQLPNGEKDLTCWKTIGVGKLHHNLYLLQSSSSCDSVSKVSSILQSVFKSFVNSVSAISKPYLWYLRLGHVSDDKLQALRSLSSILPTLILENKTPFEKLYGQLPSFDHLKVFGCLCFASTLDHTRNKFEPRSTPCVFLGYPFGVKGYKLLNLLTKKIFLSRDVIFHETVFPFASAAYSPHSSLSFPHIFPSVATGLNFTSPLIPESFPSHTNISVDSSTTNHPSSKIALPLPDVSIPSVYVPASFANSSPLPLPSNPTLRKSARISKPPAYLQDFQCSNVTCDDHALSTFPNKFGSCLLSSDGSVERYKARLVAKGFTQQEGLDFTETFSPVAKMATVKTLLAIAIVKGWHLSQLDVNNTFLHGDLHEEVYMQLPQGFHSKGANIVCKLNKSLYGLKQASKQYGILIASNDIQTVDKLKVSLDQEFKLKDLGVLKYFLGLEVARSGKGISICQRKYALEVLKKAGCPGQGILLSTRSDLQLKAYINADWASCIDIRRSTIGYCVFLGDSLISWKSKKQSIVS
ncbi:uncharacterized protein LOC142622802 [Castanea sativa]|uniref:uncharacterized protein LOC142622802 n=1 Tax=Castanea sativa TaxID=21020 RepID=UPI003F64F46C